MTEIELLSRRLQREKSARKQAESILESKALELYAANESLKKLNESLEEQILERTSALRESESKYRNVIDQVSDIIYTTDEDGNFTFINAAGSSAFGYSLDEILGRQYIEFVPEDYKQSIYEYYISLKEREVTSDYFEFPIRSKEGKIHWIGQNVNRIQAADGRLSYNAVARDISLRKRAEKDLEKAQTALAFNEAKYRSVLENMDLGLMEVDVEGKIVRVYETFCQLTGYTEEELVGKDALETFIVEGFEKVLQEQDSNRLDKQSGVYEVQIKHKNGRHIWVLISGAPFYDDNGEVIGSLGVHYDITDRKELEDSLRVARHKAVKAQKAEQQFLANMSHEIRTPLNAIIGMSHLLRDTELDGQQKEFINILSDSAGLLKGLVSDILDISKIDSGMAEQTNSNFILLELLETLVNTFSIRAAEKGVLLRYRADTDLDVVLFSDRQWINQVLINLISNAIKFTDAGKICLIVNKVKEENGVLTLYFEVNDTGVGIKESELSNIFSSFKQANNNVRKNYGGTGLGLYISSKLVSMLGGKLEVESTELKGSKFFFTLDIKKSVERGSISRNIQKGKVDGFAGYKILIVEDNKMNQTYITSLCKKWKIEYDIAENGEEAVEAFKQNSYDLVFMDLSMPIMDGYEATRLIRLIDKPSIPIIALTASTFLSKKQLALQAGMTDFLAKPFVPQDLFQMLGKYLDIRSAEGTKVDESFTFDKRLEAETLRELYQDDFAYALEMFETFQSIVDQEVSTLKDLVKAEDRNSIAAQAHKIKPIFTMVGLNEISTLCENIELEVHQISGDELQIRFNKIGQLVIDSKEIIQSEVDRLRKISKSKE